MTNTDNDVGGDHGDADDGPLTTTEAGGTATFTVVLNTQPTANVTIALSSSNPAEGTVLPASLIFTTANWNVAQTVTVTGVDDAVVDGADHLHDRDGAGGEHGRELQHAATRPTSLVTNTRQRRGGDHGDADDAALTTTEAGGTATFTVVLNTQPTANVTIALSSSNTAEGTVLPASLIFTTANWNVAQTVTVTGVDDAVVDGADHLHDRDGAGGEHRPQLQQRERGRRPVTNTDNDAAGITVTPTTGR